MLAWSTIAYGAVLSAALAAVLVVVALRPPPRLTVAAAAGLTAGLGAAAWNAILHATHASQFFTDAPVAVLPASWQDTGSGVFTLAATAVLLGAGPMATGAARRLIGLAALCGLAAFLVDVYLY